MPSTSANYYLQHSADIVCKNRRRPPRRGNVRGVQNERGGNAQERGMSSGDCASPVNRLNTVVTTALAMSTSPRESSAPGGSETGYEAEAVWSWVETDGMDRVRNRVVHGSILYDPIQPNHQVTDPTQPNRLQVERFGPHLTQPNTTNKFNCLVQPNLI